jgi:hypothetical protein
VGPELDDTNGEDGAGELDSSPAEEPVAELDAPADGELEPPLDEDETAKLELLLGGEPGEELPPAREVMLLVDVEGALLDPAALDPPWLEADEAAPLDPPTLDRVELGLLDPPDEKLSEDEALPGGEGKFPVEVVDPVDVELPVCVELPIEIVFPDEVEPVVLETAPDEEPLDAVLDVLELCPGLLDGELLKEGDVVVVDIVVGLDELCVDKAPVDVVVAGAWK